MKAFRMLAGLLLGSTLIHLLKPAVFEAAIPEALVNKRFSRRWWVRASGVAELLTGAALLHPPTRRLGGLAAAALFVAVFPANLEMLRTAPTTGRRVAAAVRLPLQLPLVTASLRVAGLVRGT